MWGRFLKNKKMKKYNQPKLKIVVLGAGELMDNLTVSIDPTGGYDGPAGAKAFDDDEAETLSPRKTIWDD